jgi:cytochrome c oxidase assembly factor CtaG
MNHETTFDSEESAIISYSLTMFPLHGTNAEIADPTDLSAMWLPLEILPLVAVILGAGVYLFGVWRLRKRGDSWPIGRTISWVFGGMGSIFLATQGPLAALDTVLLWTHMVQHMILTMIAPVFLALGAPMTLALRTFPKGPRTLLLRFLHSGYAKLVTFPAFAGLLYIMNPWILYYTGLYEITLTNQFWHNVNHFHFLAIGCLWVWSLVGIDPMPRMGYPLRLVTTFITLPFHAFLGVTMMNSENLIAQGYYESLARTWGPSIAEDQEIAGGLLWVAGDLVGLMFFVVLLIQWSKASGREAIRVDRDLDRRDAEIAAQAANQEVGSERD